MRMRENSRVNKNQNMRVYLESNDQLVNEYLAFTQLEQALTTGLRSAISGDLVPKNPWCEVSRTIGV